MTAERLDSSPEPLRGFLCKLLITGILICQAPANPRAEVQDEEPLNLFQKIARAELVVHVRVQNGALRFAVVRVLESMKGEAPLGTLRIAYRDFNFDRPPGTEPIVFPDGQEEVLFLVRDPTVRRVEKNRDIYQLYKGRQGRLTVPAEGSRILLEGVRRLVTIVADPPARQLEELRGLIDSDNLQLCETAMDELRRLRAATPDLYPRLVALLGRPAPGVRLRAIRLLGELFSLPQDDALPPDQPRAALAALLALARTDPEVAVRVEAVGAAAAWPSPQEIAADLRSIAERDADQAVRYEAERAIYRLGLH